MNLIITALLFNFIICCWPKTNIIDKYVIFAIKEFGMKCTLAVSLTVVLRIRIIVKSLTLNLNGSNQPEVGLST